MLLLASKAYTFELGEERLFVCGWLWLGMLLNNASAPLAELDPGLAEPIAPSGEDPDPSLVWLGVPAVGPAKGDDHID